MRDNSNRIYKMTYQSIYPMYLQKIEKKGRTKAELNQILSWLTGSQEPDKLEGTFEELIGQIKQPAGSSEIKGVICGIRVEELTDPVIKFVRQMDKIVDELAKGKAVEKIMR